MLQKFLLVGFFAILLGVALEASPTCPLITSCKPVNETSAVCLLDEDEGCIRKYPSKCHLDIAGCLKRKNYTNYGNLYCSMESYICAANPTYARWTIFFGQKME